MAFTNIPPNLQDIFYSITDRVAKLETGPSQAMDYAQSAQSTAIYSQSVATDAQTQAIAAGIQANWAAAQATWASTQATQAQTSANGKNTITYSASTPSGSGKVTGDVWFQYQSPSMNIIGQWVWNGSSWQVSPIANTVIANLDAGKITTGTITSIEYNNGSGTFRVTPAGALTASSATITGTIYGTAGYFGTSPNYWSISSSGFTGTGSATITGGTINGSAINVPQSSPKFQVDSSGNLTATSATITGSVTATSGTIGGFTIGSTYLYAGSLITLNSDGTISTSGTTYTKYLVVNSASIGSYNLAVSGNGYVSGTWEATGNMTAYAYFYNPGHITTGSSANAFLNSSTGLLARSTASSQRYKTNIVNLSTVSYLDPKALYDLPVRAFKFKNDYLPTTDARSGVLVPGFIAEEVASIYPVAVDTNENKQPENWNDRMIIPAMLALIQEQNERIKILEGK